VTPADDEDPELARYLWNRESQGPLLERGRAGRVHQQQQQQQQSAPVALRVKLSPQKQRILIAQVMEMGFDEKSARDALKKTGWSSMEDAVALLLDGSG